MLTPTGLTKRQRLQGPDRGQAVLRMERPGAAGNLPLLRRPPHQGPVAARPQGSQEGLKTEDHNEKSLYNEHGRVNRLSHGQTVINQEEGALRRGQGLAHDGD